MAARGGRNYLSSSLTFCGFPTCKAESLDVKVSGWLLSRRRSSSFWILSVFILYMFSREGSYKRDLTVLLDFFMREGLLSTASCRVFVLFERSSFFFLIWSGLVEPFEERTCMSNLASGLRTGVNS